MAPSPAAARPGPQPPGPQVEAVLLDLDGVVRHFDAAFLLAVEAEHGLAEGTILAAAFAPALLDDVTCGRITKDAWIATVGTEVGAPEAAAAWGRSPATVDADVLAVVDELRAAGVTVGLLTNGTDTVPDELAALGIADRFDHLFNSAVIGFAKPDRRVFAAACEVLDLPPGRVAFTDDSPAKLVGAHELGMPVAPFVDAGGLRAFVVGLGLLWR